MCAETTVRYTEHLNGCRQALMSTSSSFEHLLKRHIKRELPANRGTPDSVKILEVVDVSNSAGVQHEIELTAKWPCLDIKVVHGIQPKLDFGLRPGFLVELALCQKRSGDCYRRHRCRL